VSLGDGIVAVELWVEFYKAGVVQSKELGELGTRCGVGDLTQVATLVAVVVAGARWRIGFETLLIGRVEEWSAGHLVVSRWIDLHHDMVSKGCQ